MPTGFAASGPRSCWLGGFPTERILREMRRLRCHRLARHDLVRLYLAEQWDAVGEETGVPSATGEGAGGGEPGLGQPEIRAASPVALGITHLRETMGLGDVTPAMWAECEAQDGMHFNAQRYVAVELVEPDSGARCRGAKGRPARSSTARSRARHAGAALSLARSRGGGRDELRLRPHRRRASVASAAPTTC